MVRTWLKKHPGLARRLFATTVLLFCLAAAEAVARVFTTPGSALVTTPHDGPVNAEVPEFFRFDPELFWTLRPDVSEPPGPWGDVTNSSGFRGPKEVADRTDLPRVVCLGDSCTYGLGLKTEWTWPYLLGAGGDLEVVNAGVPGYSSHQGLVLFERRIKALDPDVLVVSFGINDANPWPEYHGDRCYFMSDRERARRLKAWGWMRRSALLSSVAGLFLGSATEVPGHSADDLSSAPARVSVADFSANLRRLCESVPHAIVLVWPHRQVFDPSIRDAHLGPRREDYYDALGAQRAPTVQVVDLRDVFRASGVPVSRIYGDDVHVTAEGARIVATAVQAALTSLSGER